MNAILFHIVSGTLISSVFSLFSVADGIKYFKMGRQTEAIQYLNKALQIDETNVEALTARGALYDCDHIVHMFITYRPFHFC